MREKGRRRRVLAERRLSVLPNADRGQVRFDPVKRRGMYVGTDYFFAWQVESPAQLVSPVLRFGQSVQSPKPVVAPLVGPESE